MLFVYNPAKAYASEDESELAKASLNGLKVNRYAQHISAPFQEYFNFNYYDNRTQSIFYFKPVVPFHLSPSLDLIVRTIAPLYESTPVFNKQNINGWGDINPTFFFTPSEFHSIIIGFGPSVSIPTATNKKYIGTGKWSVGPELVVYYMEKNWVIGFLTDNLWSVAGDANLPSVNAFQFEYLISYVFDNGWYINTNPSVTADWQSPAGQKWTVPFGLGVGRVIKIDRQPINLGLAGYYNAIRPNQSGSNWQLQLQVEWLFNAGVS